jgi:hypothetical protein
MLFHLTPEDHIRTSNEPGPADADPGGGSFASERELQELASRNTVHLTIPIRLEQSMRRMRCGLRGRNG